jgi:hypothetical protein
MNRHDGSPAGDLTDLHSAAEMPQAEETQEASRGGDRARQQQGKLEAPEE